MPRDHDPDAVVAAPTPDRAATSDAADRPTHPSTSPGRGGRLTLVLVSTVLAGLVGFGVAVLADRTLFDDEPAGVAPTAAGPVAGDPAAGRSEAVDALLVRRATAVTEGNRELFLSTVDPEVEAFYAAQATMFDRLSALELARWSYQVTGAGPALEPDRAAELPPGSAIVQVRLTYLLAGTDTVTDRMQYLTVAPAGDRWRFVGDTDGEPAGSDTQRDLWDLGPVVVRRGDNSLVLADSRVADPDRLRRLADEADEAVRDVDRVWTGRWSRRPVVVLPESQSDMAALIGITENGLGQIAAVTTGSFESGLSRGDRVVINPAAWDTLGSLGRRVVLTHEMTHVATRATSVQPVPIWLSEGFADYVAYQASPVPVSIVAAGVLDEVRDGDTPTELPGSHDFDATEGDVATSYEGAWLACRMIAEEYSEKRLVRLYATLSDNRGTGWPAELRDVLGIGESALVRDWRDYLRAKAAA